ncbi:MAG TPA: Fic family protein [Mycobacterium sp.]|jgi:cell filamentation protein|nr:Fic family protein [Mycobacterium sp.]
MTPDPRDQAVAQAVAAERLEGWCPSAEQVAALMALAGGEVPFDDYLAKFRDRYPPPRHPRRRRLALRPALPYLMPGSKLLRNNFGAASAEMLADLEYIATAGRMVLWLCRPADRTEPDALDVRTMHRHLFGDVYSWAGEYRTTELWRGGQGFAWQSTIASRMTRVHDRARSVVDAGGAYDDPRLAYELARLYADFNQIHPFREGNGRAGALLLHGVTTRCGRTLDLTSTSRDDWYSAAIDSMPLLRDGRANHRPFLPLLVRAVVS